MNSLVTTIRIGLLRSGLELKQFLRQRESVVFTLFFPVILLFTIIIFSFYFLFLFLGRSKKEIKKIALILLIPTLAIFIVFVGVFVIVGDRKSVV